MALDIKNMAAEKARKKSLLLHYMGSSCYDVYETIKVDDEDYAAVKTKMAEYFVPKCNTDFERMLLREESQADGETIDQYCTRLKRMAITCDYPDADSRDREIKLQMVSGCRLSHLRKKGMTKPMTLEEFMTLGKSMELSAKQAKIIEDRHGHHTSHKETLFLMFVVSRVGDQVEVGLTVTIIEVKIHSDLHPAVLHVLTVVDHFHMIRNVPQSLGNVISAQFTDIMLNFVKINSPVIVVVHVVGREVVLEARPVASTVEVNLYVVLGLGILNLEKETLNM